jgi:hypothetical protein
MSDHTSASEFGSSETSAGRELRRDSEHFQTWPEFLSKPIDDPSRVKDNARGRSDTEISYPISCRNFD